MNDWRRKDDQCNQQVARTKSNNYHRKPPFGGSPKWQQNLPSWEKRFVTSVGSLSWKKFLEAKEFTHLYDNILKWDDSAGEEAFRNAKDRFYAKIHGLPCDIQLPKPDSFIDEVDWNSEIDQDLILELESDSVAPDSDCKHEPVVIFGDAIPDPYQHYSPYGWGDADDKMKKTENGENDGINWDDYVNKWDDWDVGPGNHWWGWNENDDNNNNKAEGDQGWNDQKNNHHSHVNNERCISSHKTCRYHGDKNRFSRNNGNRRKSSSQGHGNQRMQVSTIQGHGNQRIHVHP
ncbi:uncharacterized protein LOC112518392 [Cynara cardunculus var. scolymus]|uniref:Uncharacterized protein n=1 Tax=Cynara cardunculus var. scolymus TaxID=59895 RepID=A0A103XPY3_CYNCS|nr:uncharacterized protein LOC112518392 [Cynara cardunculus var. scolymus]KVH94761.1 hypothetical protein Ccrd_003167 [Cynara cardunculus var. scolymus]